MRNKCRSEGERILAVNFFLLLDKVNASREFSARVRAFFSFLFFKIPRKGTIIFPVSVFIAPFAEHSDNAWGVSADLTSSLTHVYSEAFEWRRGLLPSTKPVAHLSSRSLESEKYLNAATARESQLNIASARKRKRVVGDIISEETFLRKYDADLGCTWAEIKGGQRSSSGEQLKQNSSIVRYKQLLNCHRAEIVLL